jgi:hypothetical protein
LEKSSDRFRLLYDTKGRFVLHSIGAEEGKSKLCRVVNEVTAAKGVPTVVTHDGRTLRYPDPLIKKDDTVKIDLATGKVRRAAASPNFFRKAQLSDAPPPAPSPHMLSPSPPPPPVRLLISSSLRLGTS